MDTLFSKWKQGLENTRKATFGRITTLFGGSELSNDTWEELEALLIQADLGVGTTQAVIADLKQKSTAQGLVKTSELTDLLEAELTSRLMDPVSLDLTQTHPAVILLVGVNGSGKTTAAAKLGKRLTNEGKRVLLAAADTYRAAAIDQLQVWADRLGLPVVAGQPDSDPGAVAFDAVTAGIARNMDVVIVDTAGRLHTRYNLMEELKKVHRVVGKALPGAPSAVLLVLDATTGQNAIAQARAFQQAVKVNGVILTKLDSSARGGMAFSIQQELQLPILFAGLGEQPDDLTPFDRAAFVRGILNRS